MGQFLYIDVIGRIKLTGPTADPAGSTQLLSVSVDPVFVSQGWRFSITSITSVTAQIPSRRLIYVKIYHKTTLQYGTARATQFQSSVYSVGESGEFNLQPASSSSVMTMTNFAGGDESGGGDCEQCEDALDNCLEDKEDLVDSLNVCNDALVTCNAALGTCAADLFAANETILTLQGQISVICEKFVPPNGTFKYSELNSSRVGDYRTYSYSVGLLN